MSISHNTARTARALALGATLTVLVAGCGSSGSSSTSNASTASTPSATTSAPAAAGATATNGGPVAVKYKDFAIDPANLTVKAGQTITWTNYDSTLHNVVVKPGAPEAFKSKDFNKGETATFTPKKPGVYKYLCTFHPGSMQGTITVTG
jgi:plastocyanin